VIDNLERSDGALSQFIEESLKKILGEMGGEALLRQFERHHSLDRKDLATKLEKFAKALEDVLGSKSAILIGNFLVQEFCHKLGRKCAHTQNSSDWVDHLIDARRNLSGVSCPKLDPT